MGDHMTGSIWTTIARGITAWVDPITKAAETGPRGTDELIRYATGSPDSALASALADTAALITGLPEYAASPNDPDEALQSLSDIIYVIESLRSAAGPASARALF